MVFLDMTPIESLLLCAKMEGVIFDLDTAFELILILICGAHLQMQARTEKQVKPGFTNYLPRGLAQKIESFNQ